MPRGDLSAVNEYLSGGYRGGRARSFSKVYSDMIRGSGHKVYHGKFSLGIRKNVFTMMVVKYWNWFPREVVVLEDSTGRIPE